MGRLPIAMSLCRVVVRELPKPMAAPPHSPRMATRKNLGIVHGDAPVWNVFPPNEDSTGCERLFARATIGSGLFDKASIERYLRITRRTSRNGSLEI